MSAVAAIGERARIAMLALAGVRMYPADTEAEARRAWVDLPADVSVVIATEAVASSLSADLLAGVSGPDAPLLVVMGSWLD